MRLQFTVHNICTHAGGGGALWSYYGVCAGLAATPDPFTQEALGNHFIKVTKADDLWLQRNF